MFVRTAGERDLPAVRALLVETWHATYDDIYGAQKVTEITAEWHSLSKLKANLELPRSEFLVADDGKALGGVAYAVASDDGKTVTLQRLYVRPAFQRSGIGKALLTEVEEAFPEAEKLCLEVVVDNHPAVAFYKANGFVVVEAPSDKAMHASGLEIYNCEKRIG
jgi:ribosomal protein S18 acetylase RimI-like enzyme